MEVPHQPPGSVAQLRAIAKAMTAEVNEESALRDPMLLAIGMAAAALMTAAARLERFEIALTGGDPDMPEAIRPLSWLGEMIKACESQGTAMVLEGEDPAAWFEMVAEVRKLHAMLKAALIFRSPEERIEAAPPNRPAGHPGAPWSTR